jgi:hypothetical protein
MERSGWCTPKFEPMRRWSRAGGRIQPPQRGGSPVKIGQSTRPDVRLYSGPQGF